MQIGMIPHAHNQACAQTRTHIVTGYSCSTLSRAHARARKPPALTAGRSARAQESVRAAGPRRSILPLSTANTTWCGCSSPTARTSPPETRMGSFGGVHTPSPHAAAGVPLGVLSPRGTAGGGARALGPVYELGFYFWDRATARDVSVARETQRCRRSHRATTSRAVARLRRNTPRERAKDTSAFDAAVAVRPLLRFD